MKEVDESQKKKGTVHIGQVIQQLLKSYRIQSKFDEANLISCWDKVVGRPIAKRTKQIFIRDEVLFVEMESPALKHDLNLLKGSILEAVRRKFGKQAPRKIVLLLLLFVLS